MNYLARPIIYFLILSLLPSSTLSDKSDRKELGENRSKNYASGECAKVIESNPEAKKASTIINGMIDEYMLNPCGAKIWFVIELCDSIQASLIEIASYELYSSIPRDFTVYFSDTYPTLAWKPIGHFTAAETRSLQAFNLEQIGFGKFIRVEVHSHYASEYYCIVSEVKIYGTSMMDDYLVDENNSMKNDNATRKSQRKSKRKTTAYKVYRTMMVEPYVCGLTLETLSTNTTMSNITIDDKLFRPKEPPVVKPMPLPTTQPPVGKPSIFVELSNRVKALEASLKLQAEDVEKRLNEKNELLKGAEAKLSKLKLQMESFALIILTYYVYKVMLDIM